MINQYKRVDVFRCKHDSHEAFEGRVSVCHVLKVKQCLEQGCFYFKWNCRLLDKGARCVKGYKHVGKNCNGCRYYYEDKIHKIPVPVLDAKEYERFLQEFELFEDWLGENLGRPLEVYARVNSLGPLLRKDIYASNSRVQLRGYLINFAEGYLGRTRFEDFFYLRLSRKMQDRLGLARGDLLEFEAGLTLDDGRLVLEHPRRVEFSQRATERRLPDPGSDLVTARTASRMCFQWEKCLSCERGRLVDVVGHRNGSQSFRRELFCLEGVRDPDLCCFKALKELRLQSSPEMQDL